MPSIQAQGRRVTIALLLTQSLFSASSIMAFTVGAIIILQLADNNSRWAGVPTTLNLVGAALMAYPIARVMDRVGRRWGLMAGFGFGAIGATLAGLAVIQESLWLFLGAILLLGFAKGTIDQGRYAAAEANLPAQRGRALSLVVLGGTAGSIVGPTLIQFSNNWAFAQGLPGLSGPWFLATLFFLLAGAIILIALRPDPQRIARRMISEGLVPDDRPTTTNTPNHVSSKEILQRPGIQIAMTAMIVGQLVMVAIMAITPVHMHLCNHAIESISLVIMAHTTGMFGFSIVTGWLVDRLGRHRMIMAGSLILVAACLIAPLSTEVPLLATGLFLLGLGWNFCYVAGSTLLTDHLAAAEKGRFQGTNDTLISLTAAIGSLSSGFFFDAIGYTWMNWLALLVALLPLALVLLYRSGRPLAPEPVA